MEGSDPAPSTNPAALEYERPALAPPPRRRHVAFWALYCVGGFFSASATDTAIHLGHRPSDGGCFAIGLYALAALALPVLLALRVIAQHRRVPAWAGALVGVLVPPLALGLLMGTDVI
jgi:hypothetical protein